MLNCTELHRQYIQYKRTSTRFNERSLIDLIEIILFQFHQNTKITRYKVDRHAHPITLHVVM